MNRLLALGACLSLVATPALATEATAPAVAAQTGGDAIDDSGKVICKRVQSTGWRTSSSTKMCRTKAEWAQIANEASREIRGKSGRGLGK
jgi:hypothetical protein